MYYDTKIKNSVGLVVYQGMTNFPVMADLITCHSYDKWLVKRKFISQFQFDWDTQKANILTQLLTNLLLTNGETCKDQLTVCADVEQLEWVCVAASCLPIHTHHHWHQLTVILSHTVTRSKTKIKLISDHENYNFFLTSTNLKPEPQSIRSSLPMKSSAN